MSAPAKSRWADDNPATEAEVQRRKLEKEAKKRAKAERQRLLEQRQQQQQQQQHPIDTSDKQPDRAENGSEPPTKRRRLSNEAPEAASTAPPARLLQFPAPEWGPCRHIDNFENLNAIEEGSYGWVSRARETATGQIVAIKKLKMENAYDGFPVTGLREIQTLLASRHPHIIQLREVVMGDTMDDVFLVMDFIEHDLKSLLDEMREPFLPSETKTVLLQVLGAAEFLHSHWIMHRDLKTSNLLMNNRGEVKLADFGMARYYGDPPPKLTQLVVTLWYRAPELLLGADKYGTEVDMWSIGCIFGELLTKEPLLRGKNEVAQLSEIFALTGPPTSQTWPGFRSLPNAKSLRLPPSSSSSDLSGPSVPLLPRSKFPYLTSAGLSLLSHLLALNPAARPTAKSCLSHPYFREDPKPKPKEMFPTFPSKANLEKRRKRDTPEAPKRGEEAPRLDFANVFGGGDSGSTEAGAGFSLRLG
ncbi:cmgc/cdk/pitslre protein kinase [Nannizzia gypsea CBS 118893]|uniref:cyclin-dependent kinase n=1 Tax=Arthroderma gypseum (strain ATCC MYA-4604 / CBS 118893) TaxID=535722 RepID=E4V558_ARTGP|nr:cmgc/cdk/pitslre protein kinase [Nannizzia gypsea CBS 118893]EFR05132.1 cmgc/cdk/pitslre protein kinase [Nannizzia gypsea CBS 118893]